MYFYSDNPQSQESSLDNVFGLHINARDETANTAGDQSDNSDIAETANIGGVESNLHRMSEATVGMLYASSVESQKKFS